MCEICIEEKENNNNEMKRTQWGVDNKRYVKCVLKRKKTRTTKWKECSKEPCYKKCALKRINARMAKWK